MIDIGANLADQSFEADLDAVITRAKEAKLSHIIITGSCQDSNHKAIEIARKYPGYITTTVGVHPHHAKDYSLNLERDMLELYKHNCVKAVGETGLDNHRDYSSPSEQEKAFEAQLAIACDLKLPMFLHERDAHEKFFQMLKSARDHLSKIVVHCFTGEQKALFNYLDIDAHIGITGWISDPRRGTHLPELISNIPLNRLMIETDSPYLLPFNIETKPKNRRNEPSLLPAVAASVADAYRLPLEQIIEATRTTTKAFFTIQNE